MRGNKNIRVKRSLLAALLSISLLLSLASPQIASAAIQTIPLSLTNNPGGNFEMQPGVIAGASGTRFTSEQAPYYSSNHTATSFEYATLSLGSEGLCYGGKVSGIKVTATISSTFEYSGPGESDFAAVSLYDTYTGELVPSSSGTVLRGKGPGAGDTTIAGTLSPEWSGDFTNLGQYGFAIVHDSRDGSAFTTESLVAEALYDDAECMYRTNLDITKRLINTGEIKVGDEIEYEISVNNPSDLNRAGFEMYDILPPNLTYVSMESSPYDIECADAGQVRDTEDMAYFLAEHTDSTLIICSSDSQMVPANESVNMRLKARVESIPRQGFTNYAILISESDDDEGFLLMHSWINENMATGGDMLDAYENGPLIGNGNIAAAAYRVNANEQAPDMHGDDAELASSGESKVGVVSLAVIAVTIAVAFVATKRPKTTIS